MEEESSQECFVYLVVLSLFVHTTRRDDDSESFL